MGENLQYSARFYSFGPFCLDAYRLLLLNNGLPVPLAPRFVRALLLLVQNQGADLSKDYLMDQLWPDTDVEENNLTIIISALRKVFGDDPSQHKYIVTIPGRGYRFVADVTESSSDPAKVYESEIVQPSEALASRNGPSMHRFWKQDTFPRQVLGVSIAALLVAITSLGIWIAKGHKTAKANSDHTIAVLPFESIGFGSEDEYLGLGMADALVARLRNIKYILVRPTGDVLNYQDSAYDPRSVGQRLHVNVLLTGAVQKAGERIKVNVRLLRVGDGNVLWSKEFAGDTKQVLAIQDHIAIEVADALTLRPKAEEKQDTRARYTEDPEAYQLYLRGQYFLFHRSRSNGEDDFNKAIGYFQQAIAKDPKFALAYASLASAYNKLSGYVPAEDSYAKAEVAAQEALAIDGSLADAYRSLATAKQAYDWDFPGAEAAYRRSIELDPEDPTTHRWYVDVLVAMGRNQEAQKEWRRAQELDPLSTLYDTLGQIYFYSRQYKDAFLELRDKEDVNPDVFWYTTWMYGVRKKDLVALQILDPLAQEQHLSPCKLAYAEAARANRRDVESCVRSLQKSSVNPGFSPYHMAILYAALKDKGSAFYWLDRARQAHAWGLSYVKVDPRIDELRADARFGALLQNMGLQR